jgi:hypothetical protein
MINPVMTANAISKLSAVDRIIKWGSTTNLVNKCVTKNAASPNFYPNFVLGLIILYNIVGTAAYTIASLRNEGMPKEQRKFAAAIDLMNGVFNFIVMAPLGLLINQHSENWSEQLFKNIKHIDRKYYESAQKGFRSVLTILVAGVFVQRVIVPFLATPCAKWFKEKYMSKDKNLKINQDRKFIYSEKLNTEGKSVTNISQSPFQSFEDFQNRLNTTV